MVRSYLCLLVVCLLFISYSAPGQTESSPLFTFGVITDVQYCDCDNTGTRHYRSSLRKLNEAVKTFNQQNVTFVTHLGDFIDHDAQSFDTLNKIVKHLNSPLYQVLGNHDFAVNQEEIKKVPATLQLRKRYYTFSRNQWRFIVLDGNDKSVYGQLKTSKAYQEATRELETMKAQKAPNAQIWNGGLGEKQMHWLKKQLVSAARKGEKVLILCHFPLMPDDDRHTLWNHTEVKALLEHFPNVRAYFNGHVHQSSHYSDKGIHYVTFKGMVEKEENGYAIVEVYPDHLQINGYATEVNRLLK